MPGVDDESAHARIARYVERKYQYAREVSVVRGVTRPNSYAIEGTAEPSYIFTFAVDTLTSITHRCIQIMKPGDHWVITSGDSPAVYTVALTDDLVRRLVSSAPDRRNNSHHVSADRLHRGFIVVRTADGDIEIPVQEADHQPPSVVGRDDVWASCARLIEIYPFHEPRFSRDTEAFRIIRTIEEQLEQLVSTLVPNDHWLIGASVGKGRWADVPWCAIFDTRETNSAQRGVYPVLHFVTGDQPGLRMGLGVSWTEFGNAMPERAREVAEQIPNDQWERVLESGFSRMAEGQAGAIQRLDYTRGMVFAQFAPLSEITRRSAHLTSAFRELVKTYVAWVERKPSVPAVANSQGHKRNDMDWLASSTHWDVDDLNEIVLGLKASQRQVVLAGPPGTGKTWVSQCIADHLTEGVAARKRTLQFHPTYSYEQFIEGLKPIGLNGSITFDVEGGHLRKFVEQMSAEGVWVLLLDEMNRANLPRVFGELMYALEYRGQAVDLAYTRGFLLPENLVFIGTMNTADRSIRSIDIALRRRFDVYECRPNRTILERYYAEEHANEVGSLFDGFEELNDRLEELLDRHHTIGHAFFMKNVLTAETLNHIWKHKVWPIIEEYFFSQPDQARTFTVKRFWPDV